MGGGKLKKTGCKRQTKTMVYLVGVTGPSCSGKTSICAALVQQNGYEIISQDEFFVEHEDYPMHCGYKNMDSPDAIKTDEFVAALESIKAGHPTEVPVYDKIISRTVGRRIVMPTEIVLVEGFLLLHDERVRELLDIKIFLDLSVEEQLKRRVERNVHADLDYFHNVIVPMFAQYGAPAKKHSDHLINTERSLDACIEETKKVIANAKKLFVP